MQERRLFIWFPLMLLTALFGFLYLWFSLFPGAIGTEAQTIFSTEQIQLGRDYSKGTRITFILSFLIQVTFLVWFLWKGKGDNLSYHCQKWSRGNSVLGFLLFYLWLGLFLVLIQLPFAFFSGFIWQHNWGFSTQTLSGWTWDFFRQFTLDLVIGGVGVVLLYGAFRIWPRLWWVVCATLFSLWLVIQTFLWPIFFAPIFNSFQPVQNPEIIEMVHEVADKADLEIREILVMDASKRTTKANAYFAGVGSTKQIVLYDNLLNYYSQPEIKAVIAHEIAHWQKGHIVKGLSLGIIGSFILWGGAYLVIRSEMRGRKVPPKVWAILLLFFLMTNFVSSPLQSGISRQMEIEADQTAVVLTKEPSAAIGLQINLALGNRSDLSPPVYIEWFSYTHPSVTKRITKIREIQEKMSFDLNYSSNHLY